MRATLLTAQRIADETTDQAKKTADETVAAAEEQARTIVATAKVEADQARADLADLKKAADDYRARFQRLVLDQVHVLKSDTELFADKCSALPQGRRLMQLAAMGCFGGFAA